MDDEIEIIRNELELSMVAIAKRGKLIKHADYTFEKNPSQHTLNLRAEIRELNNILGWQRSVYEKYFGKEEYKAFSDKCRKEGNWLVIF